MGGFAATDDRLWKNLTLPNATLITKATISKPIVQPGSVGRGAGGGSRGRTEPVIGSLDGEVATVLSIFSAICFSPIATPASGAANPDALRIASAALSSVRLVWQPPKAVKRTSARTPLTVCGVVLA